MWAWRPPPHIINALGLTPYEIDYKTFFKPLQDCTKFILGENTSIKKFDTQLRLQKKKKKEILPKCKISKVKKLFRAVAKVFEFF